VLIVCRNSLSTLLPRIFSARKGVSLYWCCDAAALLYIWAARTSTECVHERGLMMIEGLGVGGWSGRSARLSLWDDTPASSWIHNISHTPSEKCIMIYTWNFLSSEHFFLLFLRNKLCFEIYIRRVSKALCCNIWERSQIRRENIFKFHARSLL
jgi:hypothetical protein